MNKKPMKCGKTLQFPAMFVNPQNQMEAELVNLVNQRYPTQPSHAGINYIDGIMISIKDLENVTRMLDQKCLSEYTENKPRSIESKIKIVDPSLHFLFQGTEEDKNSMLETGLFPQSLVAVLAAITSMAKPTEKIDALIDRIYPSFDTLLIRNLLEFQIKNHADIVIFPSVPITTSSKPRFRKQLAKVNEMNKTSRILYNTVFKSTREALDSMSMLTINTSVITPENMHELIEAIAVAEPDHIGIRPQNFSEADVPRTYMLLQLIEKIANITNGKIPIHLFNVTELGYVSFCHGSTSMITPIATDPYFRRKAEQTPFPKCGAYYHPIDMTSDPYEILLDKTRKMNYSLPCHCEICSEYKHVANVPKEYWNKFRRIHFMLVKSMEMKELKESTSFLKTALKDKFARSDRTQWLPFLD